MDPQPEFVVNLHDHDRGPSESHSNKMESDRIISDDECAQRLGAGHSVSREVKDSCCRSTLAFLFLFYNMTLNLFVLAMVHERVPTYIKTPLPDLAFEYLPKRDWALDIAEYIILAQVSLLLLLLFLHRYR